MQASRYFVLATKLIPIWFVIWLTYAAINYPFDFSISAVIGIAKGAIYALIALGFGLIYRTTELINLAHGEVFMIGAVVSTFFLIEVFNATTPSASNWILLIIVLIISMAVSAGLSLSTEVVIFKRLRGGNKLAPLIASIGLALVIQNIALKINGSGPKKFDSIVPRKPAYPTLVPELERTLVVLIFTLPIIFACSYLATKSKNGLAIRAVSESYEVASMVGVNVNKTIQRVFIIAGVSAGAAGVMYSQQFRVSSYALGVQVGLVAYAAAIIGGVHTIRGTVFGGFFVGILEALSNGVPSGLGYRWSETAIFSVFILMLVYRPYGLLGDKPDEV